ncbi:dynamin family protein [Bacillus sp. N9]
MPVSPNPTTAAINRICPPDAGNRHGTASVHLKTAEQIEEDIRQSLQMFGFDCHSLADAYAIIPNVLATANTEGAAHIHLSFLEAFHQGYEQFHQQLGTTITTDLTDFRQFVANESHSCFVEAIDLYYDCSFTRQGITLVDTPGADSINARHTGVAFDYIKNSDAILFVTYYNHAFSRADREFLIQLGRVKDAFELDKMFFIVNAIDLAQSSAEVDEVLHYVENQLHEYGIRFPRIFGVSSKLAQQPEEREASNIGQFEQAFHHFLEADLQKMAIQAAEASFHRAVHMLEQLIATASEDEHEKERRKAELIDTRERVKAWLLEAQLGTLTERMNQEIEELLYYVKQRVFYRFPDFFKEAFNPALLTSNQRHLLKRH